MNILFFFYRFSIRKQLYNSFRQMNLLSPGGAGALSSANVLVGTGFVSQYRLQPTADF